MTRRLGALLGMLAGASAGACGEDVRDEAADLDRPSGLVLLLRNGGRADLVIADAEADGLRVLQLEGGEGRGLAARFVNAPAVFEPILVQAPGFPTVAAAFDGTASSSVSATRRVFALSPGSDALHATWVPTQPFGVSSTRVEGHRLIGSFAVNRPSFAQPEIDPPVPVPSLLELDPGLADFIPVDFLVMDERPFPGTGCSAAESTGTVTRGLLLLQARQDAGAPGALVALDLLTAEPEEPCAFSTDDFPLLERSAAGVVGARALRVQGPSDPRELISVPDGLAVVTTARPDGGAGLVHLPGLDDPLSVLTSSVATGGPASAGFGLPAGAGSPAGFAWLRQDEPLMEVYVCPDLAAPRCEPSPFPLEGPYDDPEEGLVSGPGVLVLRGSPVVAGAFGFSPLGLTDALGGQAVVAADSVQPGSDIGVATLVHRDGVASILAGAPSQLDYVTRRELTFIEDGQVTTPAQRRFAEISPRNEPGAETGPPNCENQTTVDAVQRARDRLAGEDDGQVIGEAPFACIDDPEPDERRVDETTFFPTLRAPTSCPGVEIAPRPLDGIFRASFRGPLFESRSTGQAAEALFDFGDNEIEIFFEAVSPPVDFVEREIRVGDAVHFFATCDAIEGPDIEVSIATVATSTAGEGAGVVQLVEPQRLRFGFDAFTRLELETAPIQLPYDPAVEGPFSFAGNCELVRVDQIEVFPAGNEAVLTRETDAGEILEVVERVPAQDGAATFTKELRFQWQAEDGFACRLDEGQDSRDPDTGQLPAGQEPSFQEGDDGRRTLSDVPCVNSRACGSGRSCEGGRAQDCAGTCAVDCASFGACFVGLVQRSCPEIELRVNGDDPLVVDLNSLNTGRGGVRFPGAIPEAAVHVPNRDSFFVSFPGSRTLRELRFRESGVSLGLTR